MRFKKILLIISALVIVALSGGYVALNRVFSHEPGTPVIHGQLRAYTLSLHAFNLTYGTYPTFFEGKESFNLGQGNNSEKFMQTLSGRDADEKPVAVYGNRRSTPFYSFAEQEYLTDEATGKRQIVDAFGNTNIVISIDHDGDGFVTGVVNGELQQVRGKATAYTLPFREENAVSVYN